nr:MAG TPA: hypothetical protein [Bacteriophage sp.]
MKVVFILSRKIRVSYQSGGAEGKLIIYNSYLSLYYNKYLFFPYKITIFVNFFNLNWYRKNIKKHHSI